MRRIGVVMGARLRLVIAVLMLSASFAVPARAIPEGSKPIYHQSTVEAYHVPMSDGATLYVEIKRPVVPAGVLVPVILTLSPYNDIETSALPPDLPGPANGLGGMTSHDALATFFVPRGYARAIADLRSYRESTGCWDYGGLRERKDAYELVQFLGGTNLDGSASPTAAWTNGRVGMTGGSYDGTTANQAAVEATLHTDQPSHLATIVPVAAIDRWYDYAYINGVRWFLNDENPTDEGIDTPGDFDFGLALIPPLDARAPTYPQAVMDRYRLCDQIDHTTHGYSFEPDYDKFWIDRDYRLLASNVTIPVLYAHGLVDYNVKSTGGIEMFERVSSPNKHLLLGQWPHQDPAGTSKSSWQVELWRWFDQTLLGLDTGIFNDPPVEVQDSTGMWHQQTAWPDASAVASSLSLRSDGTMGAADADTSASFVDDPTLTEARMESNPGDQADLLFSGPVATSAQRITGAPHLHLSFSSDSTSTHLAAFLADADASGNYSRIARGFINARYLGGLASGNDLVPGQRYSADLDLTANDYVLGAGHHLALFVSSSNLIWAWPDPQRATNTIYFGSGGSALTVETLPV